MRIALSGSGGTGKTVTALEVAGMLGYGYVKSQARRIYDRHKVEKSIENNLDQDPEQYIKVQVEIVKAQIKAEQQASEVAHDWITERTVLDTAAYFAYWAATMPLVSERWMEHAFTLQNEAILTINTAIAYVATNPYDYVFMMPYGHIPLSKDPRRSGDPMYQRVIDLMIRGLVYQRLLPVVTPVPRLEGDEKTVAAWIIKACGLCQRYPSPGIVDESDRIIASVPLYPECLVAGKQCDVKDGHCSACGRDVSERMDDPG